MEFHLLRSLHWKDPRLWVVRSMVGWSSRVSGLQSRFCRNPVILPSPVSHTISHRSRGSGHCSPPALSSNQVTAGALESGATDFLTSGVLLTHKMGIKQARGSHKQGSETTLQSGPRAGGHLFLWHVCPVSSPIIKRKWKHRNACDGSESSWETQSTALELWLVNSQKKK